MSSPRPFITPSGELDTTQLLVEAVPLAKLVGAISVVALVPLLLQFALVELLALTPAIGLLLGLATQFVLAVGAGLVLLYVIVRADHLTE